MIMQGMVLEEEEEAMDHRISELLKKTAHKREGPRNGPEGTFYDPFDETALAKADFGTIVRQRAEEIVKGKPLGSFLLRDSTSHSKQKCITARENLGTNSGQTAVQLEDQKSGSFLIHYEANLVLYLQKHHPQLKYPIENAIKSDKALKEQIQKNEEEDSQESTVNKSTVELKRQELHLACWDSADSTLYVEKLLANGADINKRDRAAATPLHYAVLKNNMSLVTLLLEKGASVHWKALTNEELGKSQDHIRAELSIADSKFCWLSADYMDVLTSNYFSSVRGNVGVGGGQYYYEATILTDGLMQIGWATKRSEFKSMTGVGDDKHSWAWDGYRQCIWYKSQLPHPATPPPPWKEGDVIGCYVSFEDSISERKKKTSVNREGVNKKRKFEHKPGTVYSDGSELFNFSDSDEEQQDQNTTTSKESQVETNQSMEEDIPDLDEDNSNKMEVDGGRHQQHDDEEEEEEDMQQDTPAVDDVTNKINRWWKKNMRRVCFRVEVNGKDIGVEQQVEIHMKDKDLLYPAASIGTHQHCHFNFGQEAFRYVPKSGYLSIAEALDQFGNTVDKNSTDPAKGKLVDVTAPPMSPRQSPSPAKKPATIATSNTPLKSHIQPPQPLPTESTPNRYVQSTILSSSTTALAPTQPAQIQPATPSINPAKHYEWPPVSLASEAFEFDDDDYSAEFAEILVPQLSRMSDFLYAAHVEAQSMKDSLLKDEKERYLRIELGMGSAMHWAASLGHAEILRVLLNAYKNQTTEGQTYAPSMLIGLRDHSGNSPLHSACLYAQSQCIEILLAELTGIEGKEVFCQNTDGLTPAHALLFSTKDEETLIKLYRLLFSNYKEQVSNILSIEDNNENNVVEYTTKNGLTELLRYMLFETDMPRNERTKFHNRSVELAGFRGHLATLKFLMTSVVSVDEKFPKNALLLAAAEGYINVVDYLISEVKVSTEVFNTPGNTPIMRAAANGHTEAMKLLISKGASLDHHDKYGNNALMLCCRKGYFLDSIELVMAHNPLNIHERKKNGFTAFLWACNLGFLEASRFLLSKGANMEDRDEDGNSAILLASWNGHNEMIKFLLEKGASVKDRATSGSTPLLYAAARGHAHTLPLLLQHGASLSERDESLNTPLIWACRNGHTDMADLLLDLDVPMNDLNVNDNNAYLVCAAFGQLTAMKFLLERGVPISTANANGTTALLFAAMNGNLDIVKFLVSSGVRLDEKNNGGNSAMLLAASRGQNNVVLYLLSKGATLSDTNSRGETCLLLAIRNKKVSTVRMLLNYCSVLHLKKKFIDTPQIACLAKALRNNRTIVSLDLRGNGLEDAAIMKLARMLTKNKHLTSINLYNNQDIDTNGLLALIDSLNSGNKSLTSLMVVKPKSQTESTNQAIQVAINEALERNKAFRRKVAAAAIQLATAVRILLSSGVQRANDRDAMMLASFDFLSLPSELQELVVVSTDTEGVLSAGEKRAVLRYALDRATLGTRRTAFLKNTIESISYWYDPPLDYP